MQPAVDLEQSATVGGTPPSTDRVSWRTGELETATRGLLATAGRSLPLSKVTYEEETTGCDPNSSCLGADQRRGRSGASRFQSTDIPHKLTRDLNLHDQVSAGAGSPVGSNAPFLPILVDRSKAKPSSHYFFLLHAESQLRNTTLITQLPLMEYMEMPLGSSTLTGPLNAASKNH